jgi:hypothetical protein
MEAVVFEGNAGRMRSSVKASAVIALLSFGVAALLLWLVPGSAVLVVFAAIFGAVSVGMTVLMSGLAARPPRVAIDQEGVTTSARGFQVRMLWSQIEQIRIVERPHRTLERGWLVAWLRPGAPQPPKRWFLPEWSAELGGVKLVDLTYLDVSPDELRDALTRYAGDIFDPSNRPR